MMNADLRYKIGQMLIVGFDGVQAYDDSLIAHQIRENALGGVILFDYNFQTKTFSKNIESPRQVLELNKSLQKHNSFVNKKLQREDLPLFISVDYEGGAVDRLKTTYGFPETFSVEYVANNTVEYAQKIAREMANTLKLSGFNVNFAPVVDVNVNPDNPILGKLARCFSHSPSEVIKYASIYAQEFLKLDILPVFKHFPGHGSSMADSHLGFVDVTDTWNITELEPYKHIPEIKIPKSMIMTAHIINRNLDNSGLPATLSKKILTDILRRELNFRGIIISDDMQMKAISDHYGLEDSLVLALNAGVDMFIFGNQLADKPQDPEEVIDIIMKNIQKGKIKQEQIEKSFTRINLIKSQMSNK